MRLAGLYSGGKDSTYACMLMEGMGHEVTHLVTVRPEEEHSMLFHTPNLDVVPYEARAMGRELIVGTGGMDEGADLSALRSALEGVDVDGVVTGAIASDYQWDRVNGVCEDLGLRTFSPMWRRSQVALMRDMVESGLIAIIVGTSAEGLDHTWLGRRIDHATIDELIALEGRYGINVAGEGGEYETLTLDSPLHDRPLRIVSSEVEAHRDWSRLRVREVELGR